MKTTDELYKSKSKAETILEDVQKTWLIHDYKITDEGLIVTFDIHMHKDEDMEGDELWNARYVIKQSSDMGIMLNL